MNHITKRINAPGPKRILALDGGGIRGALALGYLSKVEEILRKKHNDPQLRLCDYFDVISGTSTGSIIAGCLSLGYSVAHIKDKYINMGKVIFGDKKNFLASLISKSKFDDTALKEQLCKEDALGDCRIGDDRLRTCFVAFTKRVDTNSLWTITNNPGFKFYENNKHIPLWRAIKASSSPPTVFPAVEINAFSDDTKPFEQGAFTDGAISIAGNPALYTLMMTQTKNYGFNWEPGKDKLFMLSVGTGKDDMGFDMDQVLKWKPLNWAGAVIEIFLNDSKVMCEMMLQLLSETPTPRFFDKAAGFMEGAKLTKEPLQTYVRYNFPLSQHKINELGGDLANISLEKASALRDKADGDNAAMLFDIGVAAASNEVKEDHFPAVFDLKYA